MSEACLRVLNGSGSVQEMEHLLCNFDTEGKRFGVYHLISSY